MNPRDLGSAASMASNAADLDKPKIGHPHPHQSVLTRPSTNASLLTLILILSIAASGCIQFESGEICPLQTDQAQWNHPGIWEAMPEPGNHSGYNLFNGKLTGHPIIEPNWGRLSLKNVKWSPEWEEANTKGTRYQLSFVKTAYDPNETITAEVPDTVPDEKIRSGFLEFTTNLTLADPQTLERWADEFEASREVVPGDPGPTEAESKPRPAPPSGMDEFSVTIEGPYRIEQHYNELTNASRSDPHPYPWDGPMKIDEWSFQSEVPTQHVLFWNEPVTHFRVTINDFVVVGVRPVSISISAFDAALNETITALGLPSIPEDSIERNDFRPREC